MAGISQYQMLVSSAGLKNYKVPFGKLAKSSYRINLLNVKIV